MNAPASCPHGGCDAFVCGSCADEVASLRKQLADAKAERMSLETMLVDAMGCLQFYAGGEAARGYIYPAGDVTVDAGKRARVTLRRLLDLAEDGNSVLRGITRSLDLKK